jgi:hypothetical protein
MTKVFTLKVDNSQIIDDIPNIHKINTEDYQDLCHILASEKHSFSNIKIVARANFLQLSSFDFIANDLNIPIFSKRFIDLLDVEKIDEIDLVSLILIDDTFLASVFEPDNTLKFNLPTRMDFFSLKFKTQLNLCNQRLSKFMKLRSNPDTLGVLKKPVLNIPTNGFPNIFRIKESVSLLFVSEKIKQLIESNNIKGCVFEEVETTSQTLV